MLAIVKADNEISLVKLSYLKRKFPIYFVNLPKDSFAYYEIILNTEIDINGLCVKIRSTNNTLKLELLYHLFSLATTDKSLTEHEEALLLSISKQIGIPKGTYNAVKKMFAGKYNRPVNTPFEYVYIPEIIQIPVSAYNTLGISSDATVTEIKSAFRKLAKQCHPDKFGANQDLILMATEEFKTIEQAFEIIKKERNFK